MISDALAPPHESAARSVAALADACSWLHLSVGHPVPGLWFRLDQLTGDGTLRQLRTAIARHTAGVAGVEAAAITSWVSYAVAWLVVAGPFVVRRRPAPTAEQLWVGLHPDELWIDRLAIAPEVGWVDDTTAPPEDAAADAMPTFVALLAPLVEDLARRRLLGRRALWGSVADALSHQALAAAVAVGHSDDVGMAVGTRLLEALPVRVQPPEWMTVERGAGMHTVRIKQSCCLAYKTPAHGWCTTCPLADDVTRAAAFETWLGADALQT